MSHVRPKTQKMDISDQREQLIFTLKMAYKRINSLNAATRKINAVMAILFMRRDKAKSDIESLARKLAAKLADMHSSLDNEITKLVDKKVQAMEEKNQFIFDKICSLGEVCVEAEKVLKIQNEEDLANDGERLTDTFRFLLDDIQTADEVGDLEDSMFVQFVPGGLESMFSKCTLGQIYSSNRDSGISFSCANTSSDFEASVSPVTMDSKARSRLTDSQTQSKSSLVFDHSENDNVPCPPGFESDHRKSSPTVMKFVSQPPIRQSTPILETKRHSNQPERDVQGMEIETRFGNDDFESKSADSNMVSKTCNVSKDSKLPVIMEKTEDEACEIREMSSAMSIRLRKNIYDRMNEAEVSAEEIAPPLQKPQRESKESWEKRVAEIFPSVAANLSSKSHVRKLFNENSGNTGNSFRPTDSNTFRSLDHSQNANTFGSNDSHSANSFRSNDSHGQNTFRPNNAQSANTFISNHSQSVNSHRSNDTQNANTFRSNHSQSANTFRSAGSSDKKSQNSSSNSKDPSQDDWWDMDDNRDQERKRDFFNRSQNVDSWEDLDLSGNSSKGASVVNTSACSVSSETSFNKGKASSSEVSETKCPSRPDSPSIYTWGQPTEAASKKEVVKMDQLPQDDLMKKSQIEKSQISDIANDKKAEEVSTNKRVGATVDSKASRDIKDEPNKDNVPKKTGSVISGRMKSLLKTYIESNKENIPHAKASTKVCEASKPALETLSDLSETYKSKLLMDTNKATSTPEKTKPEEKSLTSLGHVPLKSKPPERSQLRKAVGLEEEFGLVKVKEGPVSPKKAKVDSPMPKGASQVKVKGDPVSPKKLKVESPMPKAASQPDSSSEIKVKIEFESDDSDRKASPTKPTSATSSSSGLVSTKQKTYTDLSQLVFSGNCWSELSAHLSEKVGHMHKGEGDGLFFPIGIGYTGQGHIVIADNGNNLVKIFKDGNFVKTLGVGEVTLNHPSAVVVNDDDEIYVKDNFGMYKFDLSGQLLLRIGQKLLKRPYGLALTYNGYLVTLDVTRSNHLLYLFNQDGTVFRSNVFGPLMNNMANSKCRFLEVYREKVLVSDLGLSVMYLGNLFGQVFRCFGYLGTSPGMLREPSGVTVDSAGNWIIADSKNDRIQVYSPNGQYLFPIKLSEPIYRPSDIHLTPDRQLLIVNYLTHSVKVYKLG